MLSMLPMIEIVERKARIGKDRRTACSIYLIRYNNQVHEGGWANKAMATAYADRLFSGLVVPKLLPIGVE